MKKVEYSQIVRRKLKTLRVRLTNEFGLEVSKKSLRQITNAARSLEKFAERGVSVSAMYDVDEKPYRSKEHESHKHRGL